MGKLKKEKHNHKLTDFLKVGIFSLVMLAPFISIGSKMAYVALNKNAKDSYYGETINEKTEIQVQWSNLQFNNNYVFDNPVIANFPSSNLTDSYILVEDVVNINGFQNNVDLTNCVKIRFYLTNNYNALQFYDSTNTQIIDYNMRYVQGQFSFTFKSFSNNTDALPYYNYFKRIEYNKDSYLDNVFEYAVNQLGETQIFAWTKNTAIYTPIETMTNGLGLDPDNNTLAILLTYWSLVTAVYVIMDIVLFAFTKITHFTQD